jgi:thioredoxin-related protein
MRKLNNIISLVILAVAFPSIGLAQQPSAQQPSAQQPTAWQPTLENARRAAAQSNKLVLMFFCADWCQPCHEMEQEVFAQPKVMAELQKNYVPVKINVDNFPATRKQYSVIALPTTVVTTAGGIVVDTVPKRFEPTQFMQRMNQIAAAAKQKDEEYLAQVMGQSTQRGNDRQPQGGQQFMPASLPGGQPAQGQPQSPQSQMPIAQYPQPQPQPQPQQPRSPQAQLGPGNLAQSAPPAGLVAQSPQTNPPLSPSLPVPSNQRQQPPAQPPAQPSPQSATQPAQNPPLALDGYCPVRLVENRQWVFGDRRWGVIHRGRTYLFSGPEEKDRFFADPDRYAPALSGNDVVLAVDRGQFVPGMREYGVFFNDKIFLFSDKASLDRFGQEPARYADAALQALRTGSLPGRQLR